MERIIALQALYEAYNQEATRVRRTAKPFDGVFGMGNDPRNNPCHDLFYDNVRSWVQDFETSAPSPEVAAAAVRYLLETPAQYRQQECYWYMYACIGFAERLIPFLKKEDCAALSQLLSSLYAKYDRMPVQRRVLKLLTKAGK